jgi:hypothetical protein
MKPVSSDLNVARPWDIAGKVQSQCTIVDKSGHFEGMLVEGYFPRPVKSALCASGARSGHVVDAAVVCDPGLFVLGILEDAVLTIS